MWICVETCPKTTFYKINDLINYMKESGDISMCAPEFYQKQINISKENFSNIGSCPQPPVYERFFFNFINLVNNNFF